MTDHDGPPEMTIERLRAQFEERYRPQGEIERRAVNEAARLGLELRTATAPERREEALEKFLQAAERISRLQRERRARSGRR